MSYICAKYCVILTSFNKYKTIVKSITSLEIEITEMMKRHQNITKLQSELIQEKMFIDLKLDEAIAKHCYLEKTKYELLLQVVIPKIPSHVKFIKVDKTPNTTLHTVPITPPNTPSKATLHNIMSKRPFSNTQQVNFKRIRKDPVLYNFHDEIDDAQLLTADLNSP